MQDREGGGFPADPWMANEANVQTDTVAPNEPIRTGDARLRNEANGFVLAARAAMSMGWDGGEAGCQLYVSARTNPIDDFPHPCPLPEGEGGSCLRERSQLATSLTLP